MLAGATLFGQSRSTSITDFFNGFNSDGTYAGSAQVVADYLGVDQTSPINVRPVQGGRLSYNTVDGATLGVELLTVAQQQMDSGWAVTGESTVSGGMGRIFSSTGSGSVIQTTTPILQTGKVYLAQFNTVQSVTGSLKESTAGTTLISTEGVNSTLFTAAGNGGFAFSRVSGPTDVSVDSVSIKEVSPVWVPHVAPFSMWGDSLTVGTFPEAARRMPYFSAYNGGVGGETSSQIKVRMVAATSKTGDSTIIWAGSNDVADSGDATAIEALTLSNVAEMVSKLTTDRYFVLSIFNNSTRTIGTFGYNLTMSINEALAAAYPGHFIDMRAHLLAKGTGTGQDAIDVNNGVIPASLRVDSIHLTTAGYQIAAQYIGEFVAAANWYSSRKQIHDSRTAKTRKGGILKYAAAYLGYKNSATASTNYTRPAANSLRPNNFGVWGRCVPSATGQATVDLWSARSDANNLLEVYMNATQVRFYKVVAGAFAGPVAAYTHASGTAFEFQVYQSAAGMGIRVKEDGGEWSAWAETTDATSQLDAVIPASYQIGAMNNANHFAGNIPFIATIQHPDPKGEIERLSSKYP